MGRVAANKNVELLDGNDYLLSGGFWPISVLRHYRFPTLGNVRYFCTLIFTQ